MGGAGIAAIGIGFLMSFKAFGLVNIDKASSKLKQLDKAGESSIKMLSGLKAAAIAGGALMTMGGVAAAGFAKASKTASDFEYAFAEVQTLFRDINDVDLPAMEKLIKDVAQAAGEDLVTTTKAMYQVISAGFQEQEIAQHILERSSKAAVAGISTTKTAVDSLTSVLNAFGLKAKYAAGEIDTELAKKLSILSGKAVEAGKEFDTTTDIFDTFFVAVVEGKTTFDELNEGLGRVVPVAQTLGLSYRDLIGTTSILTKFGLDTNESYTGLRSIMIAVEKQTERTALAAGALGKQFDIHAIKTQSWTGFIKELGSTVDNFAGEGGMGRLEEAMKSKTLEVGGVTLDLSDSDLKKLDKIMRRMKAGTFEASEMIFWLMGRIEGANAASAILSNQSKIFLDMMDERMPNSAGKMMNAFQIMSETFKMTAKRVGITMQIIREEIGSHVNAVLYGPLRKLEDLLERFRKWMENNPAMTNLIVKIGMIASATAILVGGLMIAGSALLAMIVAIKFVGVGLLLLTAKFILIGAVVVGVFTLIAATIMKNWDKIKAYLQEQGWIDIMISTWEWFKEYFSAWWEAFKEQFSGIWDSLVDAFAEVFKSISVVGKQVVGIFKLIFGGDSQLDAKKMGHVIGSIAGAMIAFPFKVVIVGLRVIAAIIHSTAGFVTALSFVSFSFFKLMIEGIKKIPALWKWMVQKSSDYTTGLFDWVCTIYGKISDFIKSTWEKSVEFVKQLLSDLGGLIKKFFSMEFQGGVFNSMLKVIDFLIDKIRNFPIDLVVIDPIYPFKNIPRLAEYGEGGLVTQPTIAKIGEEGPELLIPLRKLELEGKRDSNGLKFDNLKNLGSVNVASPNVNLRPTIKVDGKDIIAATDRRNVLTIMSSGKGLHYSWSGVA